MTIDRRRNMACIGKVRYPSRRHADKALAEILGKQRGDRRLNVYQCRYCPFLHIGHRPERVA